MADSAQMIIVMLERCIGHDYCKSPEEIEEYFSNRFIQLYYNQIRFDSEKYGPESIIMESKTIWLPVSTQI